MQSDLGSEACSALETLTWARSAAGPAPLLALAAWRSSTMLAMPCATCALELSSSSRWFVSSDVSVCHKLACGRAGQSGAGRLGAHSLDCLLSSRLLFEQANHGLPARPSAEEQPRGSWPHATLLSHTIIPCMRTSAAHPLCPYTTPAWMVDPHEHACMHDHFAAKCAALPRPILPSRSLTQTRAAVVSGSGTRPACSYSLASTAMSAPRASGSATAARATRHGSASSGSRLRTGRASADPARAGMQAGGQAEQVHMPSEWV